MKRRYLFIISLLVDLLLPLCVKAETKVPVLMYHEIVPDARTPGETVIYFDLFQKQMQYLADNGYTTLSMGELIEFMKGKRKIPKKSVVLNFDDGWRSVLKAIPVLEKHNFKASFWVITGDGFGDVYLSWPEIIEIDKHPNFEIGCHTVTHPWDKESNLLTWLEGKPADKGIEDVKKEIFDSKKTLEEHLNRQMKYLAWPCGWYNNKLMKLAKEAGYDALLTTIQEANKKGDDVFQIKRIFVNGLYSMNEFEKILQTGRPPVFMEGESVSHNQ